MQRSKSRRASGRVAFGRAANLSPVVTSCGRMAGTHDPPAPAGERARGRREALGSGIMILVASLLVGTACRAAPGTTGPSIDTVKTAATTEVPLADVLPGRGKHRFGGWEN